MKKSISLLVVLALILGLFWSIGNRGENEITDEEALKVTLVASSAFDDKSFNDAAKEGTERLKADFNVEVTYIECNHKEHKMKMMNAAESADVVVAIGMECYEIAEVALEFPDVKFIWIDNTAEGIDSIPNLLCIKYAQNEGAFLAGYIAAKSSQSGIIGAIGGNEVEAVKAFMSGYKQGAEYANPEIVVKTDFAQGYDDPEAGRECALKLIDEGADVIFNVAGKSGTGIFQAAGAKGIFAIGVDTDQKLTMPEYDNVILCSMKKEIGQSIYDEVVKYMEDGTWSGAKVEICDIASGYISIGYGNEESKQLVSEELRAEADALAEKIQAGEIEISNEIADGVSEE